MFWHDGLTCRQSFTIRWPTRKARTQHIGDAWLQSRRALALALPSVIVPEEFNYLLNPTHADFAKLAPGRPLPFTLDLRLLAFSFRKKLHSWL